MPDWDGTPDRIIREWLSENTEMTVVIRRTDETWTLLADVVNAENSYEQFELTMSDYRMLLMTAANRVRIITSYRYDEIGVA